MGWPSAKAGVISDGEDDGNRRDRREENPASQGWLGVLEIREGDVDIGTTGINKWPNNCDVGTYNERNEPVFVYRWSG